MALNLFCMLGENGDDPYYCHPLPFMTGLLGTIEEMGGRPSQPLLVDDEPAIDLSVVRIDVSGGISEALAK